MVALVFQDFGQYVFLKYFDQSIRIENTECLDPFQVHVDGFEVVQRFDFLEGLSELRRKIVAIPPQKRIGIKVVVTHQSAEEEIFKEVQSQVAHDILARCQRDLNVIGAHHRNIILVRPKQKVIEGE